MQPSSSVDLPGQSKNLDRKPTDSRSFKQIAERYAKPFLLGLHTLFRLSPPHQKIGCPSHVRRDGGEGFFNSGTPSASKEPSCACGRTGCQGPTGLQAVGCIFRREQSGQNQERIR